jgi:cytoskeletal protein CcmA (bactofilin family)
MGILEMKRGKDDGEFGFIGQGIEVSGDIIFAEQLSVNGKVSGKLISKSGTLVVGDSGQLDADIDVGVCVIYGEIRGNLRARTKVEIRKTGRMNGDVITPVLLVEEGAVFNGIVRMSQEANERVLEEVRSPEAASESPRQAWRA